MSMCGCYSNDFHPFFTFHSNTFLKQLAIHTEKHIEYSPFIYIGIIVLVLQIYMFPLKFDINPIPSAAAICNKYYKLKSDTTN